MGMVVGDARSLPIQGGTVQCVVTSPPYWGLRDYGTATWEGGDPDCDHRGKPMPTRAGFNERYFGRPSAEGNKQDELAEPMGQVCSKCGARRIDRQLGLESTPDCGLTGKLRLRDDIDGDDLSLAIRGVLFGVWGNDGGWAGERDVRELLSQAIQGREEAEDAGTSASLLPKESCGVQPADQGKESGAAGADDSGLGRSMCVLRGDGADLSVPRPHQGGRAQGIRGEGRDGLEAGRQRGATKGSLSAALLELQRGARTIRTLPALIVDRASVPTECLQWFRSAECGECYVCHLVSVMREVRRVLRDDGTLWLNLGDSYARQGGRVSDQPRHWDGRKDGPGSMHGTRIASDFGSKPKDLVGIPWRVAFALQADGWYLRQDIIWAKPNPMPESVRDRCTKAHEYVFLLTKRQKYYYDAEAIAEPGVIPAGTRAAKGSAERSSTPGVNSRPPEYKAYDGTRNRRSVWTVNTQPYPEAHFATFPEKLVEPCILAGTKPGDLVMDPFAGSGTVGAVCRRLARRFVGVELNPAYVALAAKRLQGQRGLPLEATA